MVPGHKKRRRPQRLWGFLPTKSEATRIGLLLAAVGAWLDARCHPDTGARANTEGTAAYVVQLEERVTALEGRLGRVESALPRRGHKGSAPENASPAPAQRGITGWLSRWLGNKP